MPGYGTILSCRCFANEECGDYAAAEPSGWAALEIDPADFWGIHAVAHVMEMQGRQLEGIDLLEKHERYFTGGSNFIHHLWWHRAMFHLEQREFDAVLDLYDRRFRNLASPLTQALPDLYIDVQNAASMLFRLERQGINVGDRWIEIADKAEQRIGDCLSAFTQPHWMMALAATRRDDAARRMLDAMRLFGLGDGAVAQVVGTIALPVSEAVLAHRRGEYSRAVDLMRANPGRDAQPRRQSRATGRSGADLSGFGGQGKSRRRRTPDARSGYGRVSNSARKSDRICPSGTAISALNQLLGLMRNSPSRLGAADEVIERRGLFAAVNEAGCGPFADIEARTLRCLLSWVKLTRRIMSARLGNRFADHARLPNYGILVRNAFGIVQC